MEAYIAWYGLYCSLTIIRNRTVSKTVHFYSKKSHFDNANYSHHRSALISIMQRQRKMPWFLHKLEPAVFFLLPWKSQLKWLLSELPSILESFSLSRQNAVFQRGSSDTTNTQERAHVRTVYGRAAPRTFISDQAAFSLFLYEAWTVWSRSSGTLLISYAECKSCCSLSV